jgi:hypothetical protein
MQHSWVFAILVALLSPLALAVCALFVGFWQKFPEPALATFNEEELGT